jgi:hypothetical protein
MAVAAAASYPFESPLTQTNSSRFATSAGVAAVTIFRRFIFVRFHKLSLSISASPENPPSVWTAHWTISLAFAQLCNPTRI